jgi:site-specific DNA-methyltransferase (adenine-specific)
MLRTAILRGGSTPFNVLSIPKGGGSPGANGHPAVTPIVVADWWCRYLLPPGGVLLDPFCGSGTMLESGLNNGASKVIGIEKQAKYLRTCRRRIEER